MERDIGKLFVLEGGVGCGKTTQFGLLSRELGDGWSFYHEPGSTVFGEMIRHAVQSRMGGGPDGENFPVDAYAALFAYSAARANLMRLKVIPDLESGINVGLDRYWYSTYAYQGADGVSKPIIWAVSLIATRGIKPNVVLHYDLLPEIGRARKMSSYQSDIDRFDEKPVPYHQKVRANYHQLKLLFPGIWEIIDASKSIEEVKQASLAALKKHNVFR